MHERVPLNIFKWCEFYVYLKIQSTFHTMKNVKTLFCILNINIVLCTRYADKVFVGDEVLVKEVKELTPAKVTNVSNFVMQGVNQF